MDICVAPNPLPLPCHRWVSATDIVYAYECECGDSRLFLLTNSQLETSANSEAQALPRKMHTALSMTSTEYFTPFRTQRTQQLNGVTPQGRAVKPPKAARDRLPESHMGGSNGYGAFRLTHRGQWKVEKKLCSCSELFSHEWSLACPHVEFTACLRVQEYRLSHYPPPHAWGQTEFPFHRQKI